MIRRSWLRRMLRDGTGPGELAALERLSTAPAHPNVVPLIEAVADEHFLYLVFPFCEGGEMFELVAAAGVEGGMAEGEARACFAQVVAGLLHLKGLGMTHGYVRGLSEWTDNPNAQRHMSQPYGPTDRPPRSYSTTQHNQTATCPSRTWC